MSKKDRRKARERIARRLEKGKKINTAKLAKKTGITEKKANKIAAKKYFKANNPGKKLDKSEIKKAIKSGVSAKAINKYAKTNENTKVGQNKAQAFLNKKLGKTTDITAQPADQPTTNTDPNQGPSNNKPTSQAPVTSNPPSVSSGPAPGKTNTDVGSSSDSDARGGSNIGPVSGATGPETNQGGDIQGGKIGNVGNNSKVSADTEVTQKFTSDNSQRFKVQGEGIANSGTIGNIDKSTGNNRNNTISVSNNYDNSYRNTQNNVGNTYQNDYSVNIQGSSAGGGAKGGARFDNMTNAAAYAGLNNNQAARSAATLNGMSAATNAVFAGERMTGAADRITAINANVNSTPDYWNAKSIQQQNFGLGDTAAYSAKPYKQAVTKQPEGPDLEKLYKQQLEGLK